MIHVVSVHLRPEVMAERFECFDCGWQGTRPGWRPDHTSDCMECPNCGGDDLDVIAPQSLSDLLENGPDEV